MTYLQENKEETKIRDQRKHLLNNVPHSDGKDKTTYLLWFNQLKETAKRAQMTLRGAITAKASTVILTAISKCPNVSDNELKQIILEHFSSVGTRPEPKHYLK